MTRQLMSNKAGMEFSDPGFRAAGRFVLDASFRLPVSVRERLLFSRSAISLPMQKFLRRLLGGSFLIQARFTEGPLATCHFECQSAEKYFLLGVGVEQVFQRWVAKLVQPGHTVYDVGSHVGYMALLFSSLCGRGGHVFAFEPSPINFPRLKRNLQLNPSAKVTPVQAAASDKESTASFVEHGSMSSISSGESPDSPNTAYVDTIRLDDFVFRDANPAPNFVKIDTEGHAGPCLFGMQRLLRELRPLLAIEIHNHDESQFVSGILQESRYASEAIDVPNGFPRHIVARPF